VVTLALHSRHGPQVADGSRPPSPPVAQHRVAGHGGCRRVRDLKARPLSRRGAQGKGAGGDEAVQGAAGAVCSVERMQPEDAPAFDLAHWQAI